MNVKQLYERGYALGTGARVRSNVTGEVFILANTGEYMQCAINIITGGRLFNPSKFNCSFQMNEWSARAALGNTADFDVVST